jgi:delta 1-pyrroline-5-carboxylate dehydrogenase
VLNARGQGAGPGGGPALERSHRGEAVAAILARAGLPAGVLNVIPTTRAREISARLMRDEQLRKVSFTGSTAVGRVLLHQAADQVLRSSMELGGNAPFLVFDDADLDRAIAGAMVAKLRNMGESCTAANRFYVADALADEFTARLAAAMLDLAVGPGLDPNVAVGPLIDARQRDTVLGIVEDARAKGARVLKAGEPLPSRGYFVAPTVLADVTPDADALQREIFGPRDRHLTLADRLTNRAMESMVLMANSSGRTWIAETRPDRRVSNAVSSTRDDDVLDLRHVAPGGRGGLLRRGPALARVHVRRVPVPPVVRWGDRLERAVMLGRLVQEICQGGDVHVSPPIPGRGAGSRSLGAASRCRRDR